MARVAALRGVVQRSDGTVSLVALCGHLCALVAHEHGQVLEVGQQEVSAHSVRCAFVELVWMRQQVDECERGIGSVLQPFGGLVELLHDRFFRQCRVFDALTDLGDRQRSRRRQINQALFLPFELRELLPQLGLGIAVFREQVLNSSCQRLAHIVEGR
ncbi:hypothetical protein [Agrococcus sp. Ld7]|uniref:hypothetical protein n=1 Tax=Agrococcus sp. Ld7 TaxID=649148 RepID=UPI00386899CC